MLGFDRAVRAPDHAPSLDHAGAPRIARGRRGPGGGDVPGRRWAERGDDGPVGGGGPHVGGGDELRTDLRAPSGRGRPSDGALGDRVDLGAEAYGAGHRAIRHHPHGLRRRARRHGARPAVGHGARTLGRRAVVSLRLGGSGRDHALPDPKVPAAASPAKEAAPAAGPRTAARPPRPRPAQTQDNSFWFQGARDHHLLIQRCAACGTLRHPPLPACGVCGSFEWDTVESSGRGSLFSFVVVHYPQVPAFEYPLAIGLVELEEGTRSSPTCRAWSRRTCGSGWRFGRNSWTPTTSCHCRSSCRMVHATEEV